MRRGNLWARRASASFFARLLWPEEAEVEGGPVRRLRRLLLVVVVHTVLLTLAQPDKKWPTRIPSSSSKVSAPQKVHHFEGIGLGHYSGAFFHGTAS